MKMQRPPAGILETLSSREPVDDEMTKCHEVLYENARSSGLIITRAEMDAGVVTCPAFISS